MMLNRSKLVRIPIRSVHVYSKAKYKRKISEKVAVNLEQQNSSFGVDVINGNDNETQTLQKLKNLQELTRKLRSELNTPKADKRVEESLSAPQDSQAEEKDIDEIYQHIMAPSEGQGQSEDLKSLPLNNSLLQKIISKNSTIPEAISTKIVDIDKFMPSKFNQNWGLLLEDLKENNSKIFEEVPVKDVQDFVAAIPLKDREKSLRTIEHLLKESNVKPTTFISDLLLAAKANNCDNIREIDSFYKKMISEGSKPSLYTFGNVFKAIRKSSKTFTLFRGNTIPFKQLQSFRNHNLAKINEYLLEMQKHKIQANLIIYTNILQACMSLEDYDQAIEVFDMCKFNNLKLDANIYNSILLLEGKRKNLERCLDLYREMLEASIKANGETFLILAQACCSNDRYIFKAWEFLISYLEVDGNSSKPLTKRLVEVMMILASKDSDLELARIFFFQTFQKFAANNQDPGPEILNLLLETYKNFDPKEQKQSVMYANEKTRSLRFNLIESVDFSNLCFNTLSKKFDENIMVKSGDLQSLPMLPIQRLTNSKQILEESRAIWSFIVLHFPHYINVQNVSSYLKISLNHGERIDDYVEKFNLLTYFEDEGIEFSKITKQIPGKTITLEDDDYDYEKKSTANGEQSNDTQTPILEEDKEISVDSQPEIINLANDHQKKLKIPRSNALYKLSLVVSKKFKDLEYMQDTWVERGKFRKTSRFRNLSIEKKNELDFEFARAMIKSLLSMGLVNDALNIVLSTENQFPWSFYYLKNIYVYAESIGDEYVKTKVKQISRKHSPIKRSDFREYSANKYN
ncbi:Ccm1 protein [Saccharomycopsis crataegensis]|uniref:Ccm1 protein n=1 Tax=Saccharomycopsis crataegensis TaxID=43959 RepID=A0AAV5QLS1_9ASCO|nr:Ccm1 protein [Saccharomycopsis crataegensis]